MRGNIVNFSKVSRSLKTDMGFQINLEKVAMD